MFNELTLFRGAPAVMPVSESLFQDLFGYVDQDRTESYLPDYDVMDTETSKIIEVAIPGMTSENITVSYDRGMLMYAGKVELEETTNNISRKLRRSFSNSIRINQNLYDVNAIKAKVENGILRIELSRLEPIEPTKKVIKVN